MEPTVKDLATEKTLHNFEKKPVGSAHSLIQLLDSDEAAAIMKIHPKTLQKLARKGELRGVHVGKLWRFRQIDIEEWIQRQLAG